MGFKETLARKYTEAYLKKYGDRLTQVQGRVLSFKAFTKTTLWIYNVITADILVKPENSKLVLKCRYKKKQWFKKPTFIQINQGHNVLIQGLKPKKGKSNKEASDTAIEIINVRNISTKQDLIPMDQDIKKVRQRQFIK